MGHFTLDLLKRQIEDYKPYGIRAYCELSTDVGGAGQAFLYLNAMCLTAGLNSLNLFLKGMFIKRIPHNDK